MTKETISFRVARDFGETFNVSVKFLRQNFKSLFQSLIFIAGPFVLVTAITGALYQSNALTLPIRSRNPFAQLGLHYFLFILASIISNLVLLGTVFSFMLEYMEKGYGNFNVNDVAKKLWANAGNILAVFFTFTFLILIFIGAMVGIFIAAGNASPIIVGLLAFMLVIVLLLVGPPLFWQLSVVYLAKMIDNDGVFDAYGKTRLAMKSNFWWTWLIVICSSLALGIVSFVFSLPQVIYQMVLMISKIRGGDTEPSISFLIVATVCTFCATLLYSIFYVINAFHYFSLTEKKEGTGLMERINEIGQTPVDNVEQQY